MFVCACSCMCRYDVVSSGFADWTSTLLSKRDWRKRVSGGKLRSLPLFARCSPHFSLALPPSIHPSIYPSSFPYPSPSHQTFPSHSSPSSPFPFSLFSINFFLLCPSSSYVRSLSQTTGAHVHTSGGKTRSRGKGVGLEATASRIKNCEITFKTGRKTSILPLLSLCGVASHYGRILFCKARTPGSGVGLAYAQDSITCADECVRAW